MWVEIYERGERMFANLASGECQWQPPQGQNVKRASDNQWWELFDNNSSRFYYYNAYSTITVWHRPINSDIIPLAKFQLKQRTLKQNKSEISSAGNSSSSHEDLLEEGAVFNHNVTRFGSIQPNKTKSSFSKKTSQSSSHLHKKKKDEHQRSLSCAPGETGKASNSQQLTRPSSVQNVMAVDQADKTSGTLKEESTHQHQNNEKMTEDEITHRSPGVGAEKSPQTRLEETPSTPNSIKRQLSTSAVTPPGKRESLGGNMRRTFSVMSTNKSSADIEKNENYDSFVEKNQNNQGLLLNRGFMKRPTSVSDLLSYQRKSIKKPITNTPSKLVNKECSDCFKTITGFISEDSKEKRESIAKIIVKKGWADTDMANEIYAIIIKQTRNNPQMKEVVVGFELLAICLYFFVPGLQFQQLIRDWIEQNNAKLDSHLYAACSKRLKRIIENGNRRGLTEPDEKEVSLALKHIYTNSMFGVSLDELMALQKEKFPELEIPWIQVELSREIIRLNGLSTEGIFRLPGEIDKVTLLKVKVEGFELDDELNDPHVACSLLKLWLREMSLPLFPVELMEQFLEVSDNKEESVEMVKLLPEINRKSLFHLLRFLQVFSKSEVSTVTRMDSANLAMVMAPNCFRPLSDDPRVLLDNSRREINFLRNLIEGVDSSPASSYDDHFNVDIV